jgi:glycosyltransferase involved in cell wall biosynthesis
MVSFIIPAHNEAALIGATLTMLRASADTLVEPYEVIVVDDASTDATAAIARSHGATVVAVNLRHIAAARNAGARAARGDLLVFVDADTLVPQATLRSALAAVRSGAIGGGARVRLERSGKAWARALWAVVWLASHLALAAGCFIFARRDAFESVGGFDEAYFATEEIHLSRTLKARGRFVIVPEAVTTSARKYDAISLWQFLKQATPMLLGGWTGFKRRHDWWYGEQRQPPRATDGGR